MSKRYESLAEINHDLKILELQRAIDRENLKLSYKNVKTQLYPTSLLGGMGGLIQKVFATLVARKFLKKVS
ncbi:DUF6327 family protein [Zeaxanthinibacter enoshimensis]|nr:DUF6327 family protein [Zeaxanthinibacter enoshimensis]